MDESFVSVANWQQVNSILMDETKSVSVISAPNFEDRSNSLVEEYCLHKPEHDTQTRWHLVTLQGPNERDIRDLVKARNTNRARSALLAVGCTLKNDLFCSEIQNPASDVNLRALLTDATDHWPNEFDLVIDGSALPRSFLWSLLRMVSPMRDGSAGFNMPRRVFLTYSWAKSYPHSLEHETTGRLIDTVTAALADDVIEKAKSFDAIVFANGSTRNAFMTVEALLRDSHRKECAIEVLHFVRPNGFGRSWRHLMLHQKLLTKTNSNDRVANSYVFHVGHALKSLRTIAERALSNLERNPFHRLIIAPNGPKPISMISQFVADEFLAAIRANDNLAASLKTHNLTPKDCVSVLGVDGSQFLSVYSLGRDPEISCLEILNRSR